MTPPAYNAAMFSARWLVALSVIASCGAACAPAHAESELFVQSADRATVAPAGATGRYAVTLRGAPRTVLAFDDRPRRRSRPVPLATYLRLWGAGGAFRAVPPNAALVGTANGRRSETLVELLGATRVRSGVRYAVRARTGRPPRRLAGVSLFVDPAPSTPPPLAAHVVIAPAATLTIAPFTVHGVCVS